MIYYILYLFVFKIWFVYFLWNYPFDYIIDLKSYNYDPNNYINHLYFDVRITSKWKHSFLIRPLYS